MFKKIPKKLVNDILMDLEVNKKFKKWILNGFLYRKWCSASGFLGHSFGSIPLNIKKPLEPESSDQ